MVRDVSYEDPETSFHHLQVNCFENKKTLISSRVDKIFVAYDLPNHSGTVLNGP